MKRPFRVDVAERVLADLARRLERTHWSSVLETDDWRLGTDPRYLRELVGYWQSGYDWRQHEAKLNALPQFKARVGNADFHFVHVKGKGRSVTPLLLLHGWPDSFYRFHKVIDRLASPAASGGDASDAFDVVVPSLPGFAFTGAVELPRHQPTRHAAELVWRLMTEVLGYGRFCVAGGDGGSAFAQLMAIDHPESIVGVHLTDLGWHAFDVDASTLPRGERKYLEASRKSGMADGAYALVQATRPRSLAASLNDSPVGLASWIVDRFHAWTDPDRDLDDSLGKDELLTNIMLYWVTQTIGTSIYNYYAEFRSRSLTPQDHVDRPVGMALFPRDIGGIPPQSFAERTLNIQRWTEMPRGGHFAALEEPDLYARDVVEFFRPLRNVRQDQDLNRESHDVHPAL